MEAAILQPNKPPLTPLPVWKMAEATEKDKNMTANQLHEHRNALIKKHIQ